MHASAFRANAARTIAVAIAAANLGGALLIPDGDDRAPGEDVGSFVRLTVDQPTSSPAGRYSASLRGARVDLMVTVECYTRGNSDGRTLAVDAVQILADRVADALTYTDLPLKDYVSDPTGATSISGHAVRFITPASVRRLDPVDGYQRRHVEASAVHFSRFEV